MTKSDPRCARTRTQMTCTCADACKPFGIELVGIWSPQLCIMVEMEYWNPKPRALGYL